ncbi:MAG: hypothetical protein TH68_05430 [Candidatus Synechococcus spongiarum 142]|uniref:S-adenosyl-L-methionine-dependent methyltransferase n=1 Tax=Candidatus Synechococcus spongiarum 142 TaxID=1608213 RepID=A0A6N3X3K4_9SYNE|nr:MAG: hypothetical protein TH68_05430 [Candidatus Synechococcus spongiarum 142]
MGSTTNITLVNPSKTAEMAAAVRALHRRRAKQPLFDDPYALAMCGNFWRRVVSSDFLANLVVDKLLATASGIMPLVYTRARFGEDLLEASIQDGLDQYVIVGAGYDTFSVRRPDLMEKLTLYELDQAATQQSKRERMKAAGIKEPETMHYVASDLNQEKLHEALARVNFDKTRPALFSWFGVTYYLQMESIKETLTSIASHMAPGSAILFDYLADPRLTPYGFIRMQESSANFVAKQGEPWISSFIPDELPDLLGELGYETVNHLKPEEVGPRYFSETDDTIYPAFMGLYHGVVRRTENS